MNPEDAFERGILEDPEDDTRRLAYADWLEEQGDPRGEYLRAETELARTLPGEPGHRRLRKRVAETRARVDRRWGVTFGLRKITAVDDLVYYLRDFHRIWSESPALDPRSVPSGIPDGLALIYRELGGLFECQDGVERAPFSTQDALVPPGELRLVEGMLEFAWENSGNWSCRFPPGQRDPPVYSNAADVWNTPARGFQKVCDSLDHFLITLCLHEAVMSAACLVAPGGGPRDALAVPCRSLWLDGRYVEGEPLYNFYDVPGQDVLLLDFPSLWLGAHTDSALRLIRSGVKYNRIH